MVYRVNFSTRTICFSFGSMLFLAFYAGSVSDEDSGPATGTDSTTDEPGYVEILGGEEPPDEWNNLGARRERINSSSSSSDGSGFQYIAVGGTASVPHLQQPDGDWRAMEASVQVLFLYTGCITAKLEL